MKHFKMTVTETSSQVVDVQAASYDEAYAKTKATWKEGHIYIDSDDFDGCEISGEECGEDAEVTNPLGGEAFK